MANLSIFKDYLQAARSMPENDSLKDYQIYEDWAESYSAAGKDSALESSLDNASKLLYRGVQTVGDATGIDVISDFGKEGVKQQEQDLIDGGFTPEYPGTIRSNFNDGGIGQAISAAWEKTQENAALTGASLVGGGLAALTAPISLPAAAVITGTTLAGTGLMGVGEVASEMEEKGVEVNNLSALAGGAVIAALDKVGLSKLFPVGKLAGKGATEIASEAAKAGYKEQAKIFLKEVSKKIGVETATELGQEATSMGLASFEGAAYTLDDIIDRAIDTSVVATTMTSPFAVASTLKDMKGGGAKDQEPEAPPQETQPRKKRTLREMEDLLAGSTIEGVTADMDLKSEMAEQTSNAPAFSSDNILNQAPLEESPVRDSVLDEASSGIDALEEATNILPVDPNQTTGILPNIAANTQQGATKTPEPIPTVGVENNAAETTLKQHESTVELSKAKQAEVKIQAMMDRQPSILDAPVVQAQTEPAVSDIKKEEVSNSNKGGSGAVKLTETTERTRIKDMTAEAVSVEIDAIGERAKVVRAEIERASPNAPPELIPSDLDLLSLEDQTRLHELKQALPSSGQEALDAKARLKERAAARNKLKTEISKPTLYRGSGEQKSESGILWLTEDKTLAEGYAQARVKSGDAGATVEEVKVDIKAPVEFRHAEQDKKITEFLNEARAQARTANTSKEQKALFDSLREKFGDKRVEINKFWQDKDVAEFLISEGFDAIRVKEGGVDGAVTYGVLPRQNQLKAGEDSQERNESSLTTNEATEGETAVAGLDSKPVGSDRALDANAGQSDVFDAPKKQKPADLSSETTKETEKVTPEEWTAPKTKTPLNELYLKDEAATKQVTHKGKSVQIRLNAQEKLDAINVRIEALEQVKRCLL